MWYHCKGLYNKGDGRFLTDNQSKSLELILTDSDDAHMLLGTHDKHIKFLEENTHVTINSRGEVIQLIGESSEVELVASVLRALQTLIQRGIKVHTAYARCRFCFKNGQSWKFRGVYCHV